MPRSTILSRALERFTYAERVLFYILAALMTVSALMLATRANDLFLVSVPSAGGKLTEGIVGSPRFINPVLALTDADRDMTELVYSGLLKATPEGELVPDLAKSYEISEDGLTYTFILKDNLTFHDGNPVTAEDVEFTIHKIQDPSLKSPERANWEGIAVEKVNDHEIHFVLKQPYSPFLENATIGILPKHLWSGTDPETFSYSRYNTEPIGSGSFRVKKIKRNTSGSPEYYVLVPFKNYALGAPFIATLTLTFYPSEKALIDAYHRGSIESANSLSARETRDIAEKDARVLTTPLPRIFGVFFNQSHAPVFTYAEVRQALNAAVNREKIVNEVLHGYGVPLEGALPVDPATVRHTVGTIADDQTLIDAARTILTKNNWVFNEEKQVMEKKVNKKETVELSFELVTSDAPELKATAEILRDTWSRVGAHVTVHTYEIGELNQSVIRPRKYDALLFGEVVGRDFDLYAFWHTSQRNDPGLNIALYANSKTDKLLENARTLTSKEERMKGYEEFQAEIDKDKPAVFLYSPNFTYVMPEKVKGVHLGRITTPSERFLGITEWYIDTDRVWKIFAP